MKEVKLFEVTLKYFICAETKDITVDEMLQVSGADYTSVDLKEIELGFVNALPEPKAKLEIAPVPEVGQDEIPF
ncbi:MAG TPA: hypothetical protein VGF67_20990 [Ktedonobacteraceae bacterium]|jgi:hypothetical protein